jgi:hypothetical protein
MPNPIADAAYDRFSRAFFSNLTKEDAPAAAFSALFAMRVAGRLAGMRWLAGLSGMLLPVAALAAVTVGARVLQQTRGRSSGSQTNASDKANPESLSARPSTEEVLDVGVEHTFPASDPIAVQSAYTEAEKREERERQEKQRQARPPL